MDKDALTRRADFRCTDGVGNRLTEGSCGWFMDKKQQKYIGIVEKTSLSILLGKIKSATLMCKIKIALSKLSEKTFLVNDLLSEQNPLTHLKIGW